jgi:thiol-disulfide isomerase/thioredoxin
MNPSRLLAGLSALLLSTLGGVAGDDPDLLVWLDDDGKTVWSVPAEAAASSSEGAQAADLLVSPRFPPLPDIRVPLLDGGVFDLKSARGNVLLIDFWASWCAPCLVELPQLQKLHGSEKDRGLLAIAINTQEDDTTIRATVEALGIRLPIGKYSSAVDAAFAVRSLPTVILVDRAGRIRARWDGYVPGLEESIARQARDLLGEDAAGAANAVARVHRGAGRLEVMWSREIGGAIEGVLVVPTPDGKPKIVAVGRGKLHALSADGNLIGRRPAPAGAGRIALARSKDLERTQIVAYRPAGEKVITIDSVTAESHTWPVPATLLDVAVAPSDDGSDLLYLATLGGLYRADPSGGTPTRVGEESRVSSVVATQTGVHALHEGAVVRVGADGTIARHARVGGNAWRLVAPPAGGPGVGVAPRGVSAAAALRSGRGDRGRIALATTSEELVIVDLAGGTASIRAGWPGIGALAAGDLDGDGRDELLVAGKGRLTALRVSAGPPTDRRDDSQDVTETQYHSSQDAIMASKSTN